MGSVSIDDREKYPDGMATSILWFCLKGSMMPEDFQFPCGEFPLLFGDLEDPLYRKVQNLELRKNSEKIQDVHG